MNRTARLATATTVSALAALTALTAPAQAAAPGHAWVEGNLTPGKTISIFDDCGTATHAHVYGPHHMNTVLSPMADRGALGAEMTVPSDLRAGWVNLTVVCDNGPTSHVIVRKAAPKAPALKLQTVGRAWAGHDLDLFVDAGTATRATVTGPGIKAVMSPMADRGALGTTITIPSRFKHQHLTLTVRTAAGAVGQLTIYAH